MPTTPQILTFLDNEKKRFSDIVREFMQSQQHRFGHLSPLYDELLHQLEEYLLRGGKWHRPALGLLAYQIGGGNMKLPIRNGVVATELIHRFLLIHDDIMDRDLVRHNGPTMEKIYQDRFKRLYPKQTDIMYSKGNAIVAGDVVNSLAYELLLSSGFDATTLVEVTRGINQLMMETAAGWQLQTEQNYQAIQEVTEEDFFKGMQLVSASYSIVWPLRIGQLFAGVKSNQWDKALEEYGWHTGAAFQIMDDILGMFGDEKDTGKPVGHDYREGKKTFLVLKTHSLAEAHDKAFIDATLGTDISNDDVLRVQQIMKHTGAFDQVQAMARDHAIKAKKALGLVQTKDSQALLLLESLADFLANRSY